MTNITYFGPFDSDPDALKSREIANKKSLHDFDDWVLQQLPLVPDCSVLDLGCGSCRHLSKIKNMHPKAELRGLDLNPVDGFDLILSSFDDYVPDRHYDIILSSYALYYAKDFLDQLLKLREFTDFIFVCGPGEGTNSELEFLSPIYDFVKEEELETISQSFKNVETVRLMNKILFSNHQEFELWWKNHNSCNGESVDVDFPFQLSKNVLGIKLYV